MQPEKDYINGCYTRYGTESLKKKEIRKSATLKNGMYAVLGISKKDGVSADVYEDKSMKKLIFMEHGYTVSKPIPWDMVLMLVENRCREMGI